jgi:hypothetical protein
MAYRYKVVPFIGQSKGRLSAGDVAQQLEAVIREHASQGWEFFQLSDVNIEVQPGCIAGLFGATVQYMRFDQLIFRASGSATIASAPKAKPTVSASHAKTSPPPPSTFARESDAQPDEVYTSPFCYHCGSEVAEKSSVCESCGKEL